MVREFFEYGEIAVTHISQLELRSSQCGQAVHALMFWRSDFGRGA